MIPTGSENYGQLIGSFSFKIKTIIDGQEHIYILDATGTPKQIVDAILEWVNAIPTHINKTDLLCAIEQSLASQEWGY